MMELYFISIKEYKIIITYKIMRSQKFMWYNIKRSNQKVKRLRLNILERD